MTQIIDNPQLPNLGSGFSHFAVVVNCYVCPYCNSKDRKWVLDVLDKEVGAPITKTHKSERTRSEAHALLVTKTKHLNVSEAWKMIKQRFNANHIDEIP